MTIRRLGLRAEIVRLARAGRSPADLGREFGPSPSVETIRRWIHVDHPTERRWLVVTNPELVAQFVGDRNPAVDPARLTAGSRQRLSWRCAQGHVWVASVASRTQGAGCPQCAGRYAEQLGVTHPDLAAHVVSHADGSVVDLESVTAGSGRRLRWRCDVGHVWVASVASRTQGAGCPQCAGRYAEQLGVTHPDLAAHVVSHADGSVVDLESVTAGSGRRLRWRCDVGHVWVAPVSRRTRGEGCPRSAGRFADPLTVTHPHVAAEFALDLNRGVDPAELTAGSHRRLWWRCDQGHVWEAEVRERIRGKAACPACTTHR